MKKVQDDAKPPTDTNKKGYLVHHGKGVTSFGKGVNTFKGKSGSKSGGKFGGKGKGPSGWESGHHGGRGRGHPVA